MYRNESQPGLQLVEKLATPLRRFYRQKLHRVMITVWIKTSHFGYTLFFHIRMLFFSGQAEYSYFSADFSLEIFLYYSWNRIGKKKEFIISLLRFVHCFWLYTIDMYISCTVHRTVISTEHLAITNAGFFVLLDSFASGGSNNLNTVKLKTYIFF